MSLPLEIVGKMIFTVVAEILADGRTLGTRFSPVL